MAGHLASAREEWIGAPVQPRALEQRKRACTSISQLLL
jgi:hypothetical protein